MFCAKVASNACGYPHAICLLVTAPPSPFDRMVKPCSYALKVLPISLHRSALGYREHKQKRADAPRKMERPLCMNT